MIRIRYNQILYPTHDITYALVTQSNNRSRKTKMKKKKKQISLVVGHYPSLSKTCIHKSCKTVCFIIFCYLFKIPLAKGLWRILLYSYSRSVTLSVQKLRVWVSAKGMLGHLLDFD